MKRLVSLLFAAALILGFVSPAQAAKRTAGHCFSNSICFYDTYFTSYPFHDREIFDAQVGPAYGIGQGTSYIINTSIYRWNIFHFSDCTGDVGIVYPNSYGSMNPLWTNNIKCYRLTHLTY